MGYRSVSVLVFLKIAIICIKVIASLLFFIISAYTLLAGHNKTGIIADYVVTALLLRVVMVLI